MGSVATRIRQVLGILWVVDGLLQCQPAMFSPLFWHQVLQPVVVGQPPVVLFLLREGIHLWREGGIWANGLAAFLQLGIGGLLLMKRPGWYRWGLWLSLGWALVVWIFGEGFGGLLLPSASLLTGAPGSALLYVVWSAILLFAPDTVESAAIALMRGYWGLGLFLGQVAGRHMGPALIQMAQSPQPAWVSRPEYLLGHWLTVYPGWGREVMTGLWGVLAVLWTTFPRHWSTWALTGWVLATMWWTGMDFGVLGGTGTDPNTPPLVAMALAVVIGSTMPGVRRQPRGFTPFPAMRRIVGHD
ncbi:hypothetical protein Sulac_2134 [Sulfobacillus acidophilus DSM 10332]|uniref:Uncharacterized protein n=1 Tax=Sulfobacillus acidophilus (strain ATCC 700253 / DSM 10332 / NAL) TaxID=679936 RepID=G8TT05_SULAD|nr:hypothetical protein Sulac_2134 [Sulfobacillus acidophilus DSM 10332]